MKEEIKKKYYKRNRKKKKKRKIETNFLIWFDSNYLFWFRIITKLADSEIVCARFVAFILSFFHLIDFRLNFGVTILTAHNIECEYSIPIEIEIQQQKEKRDEK